MSISIPPYSFDLLLSIILVFVAFLLTRKKSFTDKARWFLMLISLFAGFRYIFWRALRTLNTSDAFSTSISLTLFLAELYALLAWVIFYIQVFKPYLREEVDLKEVDLPTVDIFIAIYNESADILYKTVVASQAIDYPKNLVKIYILDDGHRAEIRGLAGELGCEYLSRPNNDHAKAGNVNFGLKYSHGKYIMMLDCDHVPVRSFLKETMGYFQDPKVCFVQSAHFFYNPDIFQRNLCLEREIANDQDLFFRVMQPSKDRYNASFFAGSNAVFLRSALEEIGGFQTKTLTEDLHTSMELHSRGYKSVYLNKVLTAGLAPESYRGFLKQRQRWTRGAIQVFLLDNPLLKKGLSWMQKINYLGSNFYFFNGLARLIYLVAPLSFLIFNVPPLTANLFDLLNFYLPYYMISLMSLNAIGKGHNNPFWSDVYETVMSFFISGTALETFLRPEKINFQVTPKGIRLEQTQLAWNFVLPHILLTILLVFGFCLSGYRFWIGTINQEGFWISGFWGGYTLLVLILSILIARERPQNRNSMRIPREIACEITFKDQSLQGKTFDISETGLSLLVPQADPPFLPSEVKVRLVHSSPRLNLPAQKLVLPPDATVKLISDFGETTEVKGEVIRYDLLPSGEYSIGIRFLNVNPEQRKSLIRQIYSSPSAWLNSYRTASSTWLSFKYLFTASFHVFVKTKVFRRRSPRLTKIFKCEFDSENGKIEGLTEDLSFKGLTARIHSDIVLPKEVMIYLHWKSLILKIRGEVVHFSKIKGEELKYGIRFIDRLDPELAVFLSDKLK
jgi:cellulose synthase (UDP-forming)